MTNTTYDSRRIQQEGRQIDKPSQKGCNAQEHRKGKNGKILKQKNWWQGRENQIIKQHWIAFEINVHGNFPDWSNAATCEHCSKWFVTTNDKKNRFCSNECHQLFQVARWFACSKCHAAIGMTPKQSGLMSANTAGTIQKQWNKVGIISQKPHIQGWQQVKKKIENEQKKAEIMLQIIYERAWMDEVKSHSKMPDWSYLWKKDQKSKKEKQSYYSAKSQYNRACYADILIHKNKSVFPDWSILWHKSRMSYSPERKAKDNMRARLKKIMKLTKRGGSISKSSLLGCSTKDFAKYLESKFTKLMTWSNYGTYWHVDHIIPCASFNHFDINQVKQCWHWTNLQPLEASQNLSKSDTITQPQMQLRLCATA